MSGLRSGRRESTKLKNKPPLLILVIGASGDLAKRKTYPALFILSNRGDLPKQTVVYGVARSAKTHDSLRQSLKPHLAKVSGVGNDSFLAKCFYKQTTSYADPVSIRNVLEENSGFHDLLIYLAIPPDVFGDAAQAVKLATQHVQVPGFCRVVLEKPFGRDTATCQALLGTLKLQGWNEWDLFRIDHYLGKAVVQRILHVRTQSSWLENMWNGKAVQSVHIIFKETFGTDGRGGYFDSYGILRDVIQNHLLQVITLVALDLPAKKATKDAIRDAKVCLLRSIPTVCAKDCLLGQYDGYILDETIRNKASNCPTYACVAMGIPTKRWGNVPFVLEAGKAMDEQICEVRATLRSGQGSILFRIQPNPSILFYPGSRMKPHENLCADLDKIRSDDAYSELVLDALQGEHQSFVRDDELMEAWRIFSPLLHEIESQAPIRYERGTTGPVLRNPFIASKGIGNAVKNVQAAL